MTLNTIEEFYNSIDNTEHREYVEDLVQHIQEKFPELELEIKWSQPMFSQDGTYIIGFSTAKKHLAVAPEGKGIRQFQDYLDEHEMDYTKQLIRMPWNKPFDIKLIDDMIVFNMEDKKGYPKFWR
ncbi:DUF1801 domain-containing protein [Aerococcaceae bacterium DSM 111176]|nr:DUF1801 domain-containing protein [Aerococcaceae bacterium DSM 111176]